MPTLEKYIKIIQALSLDVVLGGVVFSYAMAKLFDAQIEWPVFFALAICIWLIYTIDHLMDVENGTKYISTFRHQFHLTYRKPLIIGVLFTIMLGVTLLFFLPEKIVLAGSVLSGGIIIYFILVRWTGFWSKEVIVAGGYTAGILLAPMIMMNPAFSLVHLIFIGQTFCLALCNLLMFSMADYEADKKGGFQSTIIKLGLRRGNHLIRALFILNTMLLIGGLITTENISLIALQSIFLGMHLILWLLYKNLSSQQEPTPHFRLIGDSIFFLPGVLIFI